MYEPITQPVPWAALAALFEVSESVLPPPVVSLPAVKPRVPERRW